MSQTTTVVDIGINLGSAKYNNYHDKILDHAYMEYIDSLISISNSRAEWDVNLALIQKFKSNNVKLYCTVGIHPHSAKTVFSLEDSPDVRKAKCSQFEKDLLQYHENNKGVVAVGECGLDYNRMFSPKEVQIAVFLVHVDVAAKTAKPLYIHERDSGEDMVKLLTDAKKKYPQLTGVVHCFTGKKETMQSYLDLGFHIGVTGWICDDRRNGDLVQAVKILPLDRLLIETDGPWLIPPQYAKKYKTNRNESDSLSHVIERISKETGVSIDQIRKASRSNTLALFGL